MFELIYLNTLRIELNELTETLWLSENNKEAGYFVLHKCIRRRIDNIIFKRWEIGLQRKSRKTGHFV